MTLATSGRMRDVSGFAKLPGEASMSELKGVLSAVTQPIGEEMARHFNAPPLRQNKDRAVWGTAILTDGKRDR
jgi:hypothetical protein